MGLPIHRFIASNNDNKVFFDYLSSGEFQPKPSVATISNAMDVGNPSNFARIVDLYSYDLKNLTNHVFGFTFSDEKTRSIISEVYNRTGYIMDPHGAVGYLGLQEYYKVDSNSVGVFLGTAHPAKFLDVVDPLVSKPVIIPDRLKEVLNQKSQSISMPSSFDQFKDYLLAN